MTARTFHVYTGGLKRDLFPGGWRELNCAFDFALMHHRDHLHSSLVVVDDLGRCYHRAGRLRTAPAGRT